MTRLGDYTLMKEVGKGPLGTSYLAQHLFTQKEYIIKILNEELLADPHFIERLQEKVHMLARVAHPHLVPLHTVSFENDNYYLVSEAIDQAQPLPLFLANRPLNDQEILKIGYQLGEAIDALHQAGLVHGAIKPNSILVQEREGQLHTWLSHAAIASIVGPGQMLAKIWHALVHDANGCQEAFVTHFGFLAPEVKRGGALTAASDVYAYGMILYYLYFKEVAEGMFSLPSDLMGANLIRSCLQFQSELRPKELASFFIPSYESKSVEQMIQSRMKNEHTVTHYHPQAEGGSLIEPILTEMAVIQGGQFYRGSEQGARDESPRHEILLDSFAIDKHPVTNEQFIRFLEHLGGEKDHEHRDIIRLRESRIRRVSGKLMIESGYTKHPVVGVTWYGAAAYAQWVGKRLPTEAEWEIAAQGGDGEALYPSGHFVDKHHANFFGTDTSVVMSYPPNAHGLWDMAGNVYEWCEDWYDYNYYAHSAVEPNNPKGPPQGVYRVLRGGCWKSLKEDLRCAHRHRNNPGIVNRTYGFRCAQSI